ncbi:hemin uptake protein HemP [Simplicispira psychrophila]|uniref:hemin uptake protein HemP n=1 Tax=Simplicispira psychrophila TaxID=80882 RepID=UPI000484F3AD|nr:hemin uptake protein HemP [Simplicispira psychrophila]
MPASLTAPSLPFFTAPGDGYSGSTDQPSEPCQPLTAQAVNSHDLLQGHKTVAIAHNGVIYRLQATRLGKLILTK